MCICFVLAGCTPRISNTDTNTQNDAAARENTEDLCSISPESVSVKAPVCTPTSNPTAAPTPSPTEMPTPSQEPSPTPIPAWFPTDTPAKEGLRIIVYLKSQSVCTYRYEQGHWSLLRVMPCSSGRDDGTPTGKFRISDTYKYHSLFGAKGQYCLRFTGHYLFHSVPIDENATKVDVGRSRTKLSEYEKLGTAASDGCVRLCCGDAKWLYDNCKKGTEVWVIKEQGPESPVLPPLITGAPYETESGYGWDPTDPYEGNPYLEVYEPYV